jgi:integrase
MGHVEKYGNGKFRGRTYVNGKRVSKTFDSQSAAWAWVDGTELPTPASSSFAPAGFVASASSVTVNEFLKAGGHVTAHMKPNTIDFTRSLTDAHIKPRWGDVALSAITHHDLQQWVVKELDNGKRSPATVQHIARLMKRVLDSAVGASLIPANPAVGLKTPHFEEEEMRFLNTAEIQRLVDAFDERYKPLVHVCAFGGLRIGEALGLRWKRVDMFAGKIEIIEIVSEIRGKIVRGTPKTRSSRRTVSIPRSAVYALTDHSRRPGVDTTPDAFVFPAPKGGQTRYGNFYKRVWLPAVAASGLAPLRPHDLRHTAVALWIAAGGGPKEIAVRIGHSSVSFTLDRYGHLFPSQDAALTARLDTLILKGID